MDENPKLRPVEVFPVKSGANPLVCIRDATGLSDRMITASAGVVPVLEMLDGEHSLLDIQTALTRQRGALVMSDEVRKVLEVLDEALLLEGERFEAYRRRLEQEFAAASVRRAASAGGGYPNDAGELREFLEGILAEAEVAPEAAEAPLRGLIAPHIDHARGRKSYAEAFAALARSEPAELFVFLGTAHAETVEQFALTRKDFETPLGTAVTDVDFVEALAAGSGRDLFTDEFLHRGEHSVELELVFVQHLMQKAGCEFKVVPVLCGGFDRAMAEDISPMSLPGVPEVIDALRELIAAERRRVVLIAGADLSHVGPRFGGEERLTSGTLSDLEDADRETLVFVEEGEAERFYRHVALDDNARHICGVAPIVMLLEVLEPARVRLLRYEQWADDEGLSCVTFAAAVVT